MTTPLAMESLDEFVALVAIHRAAAARVAGSRHHNADPPALVMCREQARARLREAEQALDRLADGTFGLCYGCGDPIPLARMAALPTTVNCVECSRNLTRLTGCELPSEGVGP